MASLWQDIAALAVVSLAACYLCSRLVRRSRAQHGKQCGACGSCDHPRGDLVQLSPIASEKSGTTESR